MSHRAVSESSTVSEYFRLCRGTVKIHRATKIGKTIFQDEGQLTGNLLERKEVEYPAECDAEFSYKQLTSGTRVAQPLHSPAPREEYPQLENKQKFDLTKEILNFKDKSYFVRPTYRGEELDVVAFRAEQGELRIICDHFPVEFPAAVESFFPDNIPALHLKLYFLRGGLQFKTGGKVLEFCSNTVAKVGVFDIVSSKVRYRGVELVTPPAFMRMQLLGTMFENSESAYVDGGNTVKVFVVPATSVEASTDLVEILDRMFHEGKTKVLLQRVDTKYRTPCVSSNILETNITREALLLLTHWVTSGSY